MQSFNKGLGIGFMLIFGYINMACDGNNSVDNALNLIIDENNLTGDALKGKEIPDIESAKTQLGMHLFFSKSLGADSDSACVTCHHPMLGGGDRLSLPIGVGAESEDLLGEGRLHSTDSKENDAGPPVPRNAPTTFNVLGWNKVLFHDGRLSTLANGISTPDSGLNIVDPLATDNLASAQARFPVTSPEEMKGFDHQEKNNQEIRDYIASRLGGYAEGENRLEDHDYWLKKFQLAFDQLEGTAQELITEQNIAKAIGEYENSQAFSNTPWKDYIEGNTKAISNEAKKGALLFFNPVSKGGANCASCHTGDLFSDESFHNIVMPQIGRGKGNGLDGSSDFGRFNITKDEEDMFKFRTPTLLNVTETGPWSHAGAYTSLEAVVRHHLNPSQAIQNYDLTQLTQVGIQNIDSITAKAEPMLKKLTEDRVSKEEVLQNVELKDFEVQELLSFLETLTDPCVKDRECLKKWIPTVNEDPNGKQLDAIGYNGSIL
ncbi:MAG: Cytochrome-c peroxidase [uncultured Sulfurovum sp.]|uniref:Cytochrome-c peroxidase n=1 Tax=uncultured Sulfurovum sp. TaxID=269237 RepID=A0A6S6TY87_9BACT|nr:MAG: Cytochrome-c peroxidase [uncultured Sulfurovum sp.]